MKRRTPADGARSGVKHRVAIRYTRTPTKSFVEYFLDSKLVSKVSNIGVPLDVQGVDYTGIYPAVPGATGDGPAHKDQLVLDRPRDVQSPRRLPLPVGVVRGLPRRSLDSLTTAACGLSVSIPMSERLFGQGVRAHFDDFTVTTSTGKEITLGGPEPRPRLRPASDQPLRTTRPARPGPQVTLGPPCPRPGLVSLWLGGGRNFDREPSVRTILLVAEATLHELSSETMEAVIVGAGTFGASLAWLAERSARDARRSVRPRRSASVLGWGNASLSQRPSARH
jgi:hypothetical protein